MSAFNKKHIDTDVQGIKKSKKTITPFELVIFAILGTFLMAGQVALAVLPNIEVVSPLVIVYTCVYGRKAFLPIYVFVLLEGLIYGFNLWWFVPYLYVWSILSGTILIFKKLDSALFYAVIAAIFGLCFGTMTSIPYLFTGGPTMFFATVAAGLIFDLTHAVANFVLTLILYRPLMKLFHELRNNKRIKF